MSDETHGSAEHEQYLQQPLRRRPRRRRSVYHRHMRRFQAVMMIVLLCAGFVGIGYFYLYHTAHFAVALNGKPLAALATRQEGEAVILAVKRSFAPAVPQAVHYTEGELEVHPLRKKMPVSHTADAVATIRKQVTAVLSGYAIFINGSPMALLATKADAFMVLARVQNIALGKKTGAPTFKERVVIAPYEFTAGHDDPIPVVTINGAIKALYHPPLPNIYTVQHGDSFYKIAMAHELTVNRIKELNPGVDPGLLQPGDKIHLPDIYAPLTVIIR